MGRKETRAPLQQDWTRDDCVVDRYFRSGIGKKLVWNIVRASDSGLVD